VSPEKKVAVIGVGNILMGDEGLGVHALRPLSERLAEFADQVELVDAGTALLDILDDYTSCDVLIVMDVIRAGGKVGAIYRFEAEEVGSAKAAGFPTSLHQLSVLEVLDMERLTGRRVPKVVVIGMEPERITAALGMSEAVQARLPVLVETVLDELRRILNSVPEPENQE